MYWFNNLIVRRLSLVVGLSLLLVFLCLPGDASAQKRKVFDYSNQGIGIGSNMGIGIMSSSVGAGFQFGGTAKIHIYEGVFMEPGWHMFVKSGGWDMAFCPTPMYQLRFANFPIHPYGTFGPALHIQHATFNKKGYTKGRFALHWGFGGEWMLTPQFSIFNDYKYMLILGSPAPDIFTITVGGYFYF